MAELPVFATPACCSPSRGQMVEGAVGLGTDVTGQSGRRVRAVVTKKGEWVKIEILAFRSATG